MSFERHSSAEASVVCVLVSQVVLGSLGVVGVGVFRVVIGSGGHVVASSVPK